jgi:hypothetical protein
MIRHCYLSGTGLFAYRPVPDVGTEASDDRETWQFAKTNNG